MTNGDFSNEYEYVCLADPLLYTAYRLDEILIGKGCCGKLMTCSVSQRFDSTAPSVGKEMTCKKRRLNLRL